MLDFENGSTNTSAYYQSDVVGYSDYYPFGMLQPNRHGGAEHSYGFQGQLVDNEIKGKGNSASYKYRMSDPRLGRFFAVDPLSAKYPHNSPYAFSENVVINAVELEGLEKDILSSVDPSMNHFKDTKTTTQLQNQKNLVNASSDFAGEVGLVIYGTAFIYIVGPKVIVSFLGNEIKDEALSYATNGASDYLDLSRGVWNLSKGVWRQIPKKEIGKGILSGRTTPITNGLDDATKRSLIRENESAEVLTERGFNVEQNPLVQGSKNPDYKINGDLYDNYAPSTSNVRNIWSAVKDKVDAGQTNRVVLNLNDFGGTLQDVQKQFNDYKIGGLEDIIFIKD